LDSYKHPGYVNEGSHLKIYNYTDLPVVIHGRDYEGHIYYLYNDIERWNLKHNGQDFVTASSNDRNVVYTITQNNAGGYKYKMDSYPLPDIWVWVGTLVSFFSFFLLVRLIQKIKTR
jgi:hypothetical protein